MNVQDLLIITLYKIILFIVQMSGCGFTNQDILLECVFVYVTNLYKIILFIVQMSGCGFTNQDILLECVFVYVTKSRVGCTSLVTHHMMAAPRVM